MKRKKLITLEFTCDCGDKLGFSVSITNLGCTCGRQWKIDGAIAILIEEIQDKP